jgi:hypothetical protein
MTTVAGLIQRLAAVWDRFGVGATLEDKIWNDIVCPQFVWLNHVLDFSSLFRPCMNHLQGIRSRILAWRFERASPQPDVHGTFDVNVFYMVTPALDKNNGRGWRGCNGVMSNDKGQVMEPIKLFSPELLDSAGTNDPRKMAPGSLKLSKDFICKSKACTYQLLTLVQEYLGLLEKNALLKDDDYTATYKWLRAYLVSGNVQALVKYQHPGFEDISKICAIGFIADFAENPADKARKPVGKHVISLCDGTACHVKGSNQTLNAIQRTLQVKPGQTTRDGLFSLEVVACLGACGLAPLMAVNGEFHAGVTSERVAKILRTLRREAAGQ